VAQRLQRKYSIINPVDAGVFDESEPEVKIKRRRRSTKKKRRFRRMDDFRNKPLPPVPMVPPLEVAPLRLVTPSHTVESVASKNRSPQPSASAQQQELLDEEHEQGSGRDEGWTLSHAADDLEDELAKMSEAHGRTESIFSPMQSLKIVEDVVALLNVSRKTSTEERKLEVTQEPQQADAQISKALNVDEEGAEKEDGEWSTLFPLKAMKNPGIPLMASSHIPPLPSSNNERHLRLQLPRLQTGAPERPQPLHVAVKKYLETPDGVGTRLRATCFIDSPNKENDEETWSDGNRIVIEISKMDRIVPETSTQETRQMEIPEISQPPPSTELKPTTEVFELHGNGSISVVKAPMPVENVNLRMPANTPDNVILALMMNVKTLDELFNYALVNKQFFRVLKDNELCLMKNTMFQMSPPAWELREMSPPWGDEWQGLKDPDAPVPDYTPTLYLRHHACDIYTLVKLKSLILARCSRFLRQETVRGLAGADEARAAEIDEAFWRIWTFCRIFGSGKNRETDINGQMDWLNGGVLANKQKNGATVLMAEPSMNSVLFDPPAGFGRANGTGLTPSQLYDMTEIWNCLGVLLQVVHAKYTEAREAGVFENLEVLKDDVVKEDAMLEEWTYYVLTLGPPALVSLSSVCRNDSAASMFTKAKQMGLTEWEPPEYGASRSSFLRDAVSRTYASRFASLPSPAAQSGSRGSYPVTGQVRTTATTMTDYTAVQNCRELGWRLDLSFLDMDDISVRSAQRAPTYLSSHDSVQMPMVSPSPHYVPVVHQSRYGANAEPPTGGVFIDPADKALRLMVGELGFSEHDAKWALKITDMGDAINTDAAVQLLLKERRRHNKGLRFSQLLKPWSSQSSEDSGSDNLVDPLLNAPANSGGAGWRWA
jgi:hypothetical protein